MFQAPLHNFRVWPLEKIDTKMYLKEQYADDEERKTGFQKSGHGKRVRLGEAATNNES